MSPESEVLFACQGELLSLYESLTNVMFCAKSVDGEYLVVNQAFMLRTGLSSKRDIVGRTAAEIFNLDFAKRYEEQDRDVFFSGKPLRDALELIQTTSGGVGWYVTTKLPVQSPSGTGRVIGLVSVSRDLKTATSSSISVQGLQQFVLIVRENLDRNMLVDELAVAARCSVDQLERRVRNVFGLTPKQYVLRVRVDRAAELLVSSDASLATISSEVGFYDQSDFTRRFARLTNQTPAQFRSNALAAQ